MKKVKLDILLINFLWIISITLCINFFLNNIFGFNIFIKKHWIYLQELQTNQTKISSFFYISIIISLIVFTFGLYIINKMPRRKIKIIRKTNSALNIIDASENTNKEIQKEERPKPPFISNKLFINTPPVLELDNKISINNIEQNTSINQENKIKELFIEFNFEIKNIPNIKNITLKSIAIDNKYNLWIGGENISITKMEKVYSIFYNIFEEVIENYSEEDVRIQAFVLNPIDTIESDTVKSFNSYEELKFFISENINDEEYDIETFKTFSRLINGILNNINNSRYSV